LITLLSNATSRLIPFSDETEADDESTEYGANKKLVPVNVTGSKQAGFISVNLSIESDERFLAVDTTFDACAEHALLRQFLIEKEKGIPVSNITPKSQISIAGGKKQDIKDVHLALNTNTKLVSHLVFESCFPEQSLRGGNKRGSDEDAATFTPASLIKSPGDFCRGDVVFMKVLNNEGIGYTDVVGFFVDYDKNPAYTRGDYESKSMMVIQVPKYDKDEVKEVTNYFVCVHSAAPTLVLKASFCPYLCTCNYISTLLQQS